MKNDDILCIDIKSFYASVECIDRGLNPFHTPLVVADRDRGQGTIVLAVSPFLRSKGIPSRLRVFELPKNDNIIFAKPRMNRYMEYSARVVNILLDYVGEEDLHVYSIDECFLDLTPYKNLYSKSIDDLALEIKARIFNELGLSTTVGIGPNMLLAKVAMDIESKHTKKQIAHWTYDDVNTKLKVITPLSKFWGIGPRMERKLNALGMYKIGDIASFPKKLLVDKFGIMGGELWDHANGIDESDIREKYIPLETSFSSGQVLFEDYYFEDIPVLIREMLDDLILRLVYERKMTSCVSLGIGYSKDIHGGFSHQISLLNASDDADTIFEALMSIFNKYIENKPIRRICINLSKLSKNFYYQPSLFIDSNKQVKKRKLLYVIKEIKERYGSNILLRATSKLKCSNIEERHGFVGGHHSG